MDEQLKQRLVGAAVLVLLAVIFVPMILDQPAEPPPESKPAPVPPKSGENFSSRIIPLDEPKTPLVERERSSAPVSLTREEALQVEAADQTPTKAESSVAAVPAGPSAWAVQLGSFSSARNAVALRDRLRKSGYTAFVEKAQSNGNEITRVFVGPALTRTQAEEAVKKLYAETKLKGIVVKYPGS